MKKLKLNLQAFEGTIVLSIAELKNVIGGLAQVYNCQCIGGTGGSFQWTTMPDDDTRSEAIQNGCSSGQASCGWQTCGNPGVTCGGGAPSTP